MHGIKGKLEKHPFLAKGKLSIAQKEKVQRLESEFWGLKIHGKSWLFKEKTQGKTLLKLCENWRRIQGKGVCAASFPLKLESLKKKPKGKRPCKKELVGRQEQEQLVRTPFQAQESAQLARKRRESQKRDFLVRERGLLGTLQGLTRRVEHIQGLAMKGGSFILKFIGYGGVWVKMEEKRHSQVFIESYAKAFCECENEKMNPILHQRPSLYSK